MSIRLSLPEPAVTLKLLGVQLFPLPLLSLPSVVLIQLVRLEINSKKIRGFGLFFCGLWNRSTGLTVSSGVSGKHISSYPIHSMLVTYSRAKRFFEGIVTSSSSSFFLSHRCRRRPTCLAYLKFIRFPSRTTRKDLVD